MALTHFQKNYLKKHLKTDSLNSIITYLKIEKAQLLDYLERRWGKEKLDKFLKIQDKPSQPPQFSASPHKDSHQLWFSRFWPYLFLIILVLLTYANSLHNAFVSDDIAEIAQNPNIGNFSYLGTHPFGFIRLFLYWLTFHLTGLTPYFYRLINISFHLGNVLLIFTIFKSKFSQKLALIVASIFAIHPALSEPIVWISGGTYPQYSFFFLLSFFVYLKSENKKRLYWLSVIIFALAFMSHPVMPLPLFLIFPLWELCFGNLRRNWFKFIPYFLLSITYVIINLGVLPERETTLQSVHYQEKGIDNPLILLPVSISSYLELIFYPKVLTLYHSELNFPAWQFAVRSITLLALLVSTIFSFFKNKFIFFWLSFFFIALSPTLTPFRFNWIVAERYVYLPSVGIFASLTYGILKLEKVKKHFRIIIPFLMAILVLLLLTRTIFRNIDWYSEDNLWVSTGKTSPSSPNTHNNLGDMYGRHGDKQKALQEFQTAIALKPNYADAYHNLANTYHELGQDDQALANYQKAADLNPKLWQSYQNMAAIYFSQKKYDLSKEFINKAIVVNPQNLNLKDNLGIIYLTTGEKDQAKQIFSQVLTINPQDPVAKQALGQLK